MKQLNLILVLLLALHTSVVSAQGVVSLIDVDKLDGGWSFGNGPEFPGAQGELRIAEERFRDSPALLLRGDFTGGGNYVQAQLALPNVPVDKVSFWVKTPVGKNAVPMRIIDGTDQCHQLKLKINDKGGWQQITLPVDEFFRRSGTSAALDIATQYEKWGGANDGRWHQPGKSLVFLCSRDLGTNADLLIADVKLHPSQPRTSVKKTISLDALVQQGEVDWEFNLGQEFPGATGSLEVVRNAPKVGTNAMQLHADFNGGGAYVGMRKSLKPLAVTSISAIRMNVRSENTTQFALRLVDGTGQCHQRKAISVTADGKWHEVTIVPADIAGGEHWGGADDGKWHDSVQLVELMLNDRSSESKQPGLLIANIRADVVVQATQAAPSFHDDFASTDTLASRWTTSGNVTVSDNALRLSRSLATIRSETTAISKPFDLSPGTWQVQYSWNSDLHSPDNSYHGSVVLDVFDSAGEILGTLPIDIGFGQHDGENVSKAVAIPVAATKGRFRVDLKKTYGSFSIAALSASRLKVQPIEQKVERVLLATDAIGNLFIPSDEVMFHVTVQATQPLLADEQRIRYRVADYLSADIVPMSDVMLAKRPRRNGRFIYAADITLPKGKLSVGKYHELHVSIPIGADNETTEYTGFARLPIADTKRYPAEDVPFTIRNWDSRIPDYFRLADRLGLRMLGVWGGWSPDSPNKPDCPGIELVQSLGAKWITGTPAAQIERDGFAKYSEPSLRAGMKNFLEAYADKDLAMIAMGNEPHGTGEKVLENVRAYRAIYETVKTFDPSIHVIGTSVEPNEEYFKAGYQNYLDSYDFHIYERYTDVRRTMGEYRALMKKYDAVKPIHSTELGLNSQGQTRLAVSREMIKKIVSFFAEGGTTVSWFTIQYPDPDGKARGQSGDSHCMFDCKYNLYNPRLDAITHYHLVNGIGVKKFVREQQLDNGIQSCLFCDEHKNFLQVLWSDEMPVEHSLSMKSGKQLRLINIDGTQQTLLSKNGRVNVKVSVDPILVLYTQ